MIKGKEAHDEITCDAKNCSVEIFLKVLYNFVLNDELSHDNQRVKFIDVRTKSTHILLFIKPNTARSCLKFWERKKAYRKNLHFKKCILL